LNNDGAGGGGREAGAVGDDVVDGVGGGLGGVDLHRIHWRAVDVGRDAEVEVGLQTTRAPGAAGGWERRNGRELQGYRV